MKKRHVSTSTILEPYGLVRISGEVSRNPFYTFEERQFEEPFIVNDLRVIDNESEVLHGRWDKQEGNGRIAYRCFYLEESEVRKAEEVLIEKFLDDEQAYKDTLINEAIERTRSFRHLAYS